MPDRPWEPDLARMHAAQRRLRIVVEELTDAGPLPLLTIEADELTARATVDAALYPVRFMQGLYGERSGD